MKRNPPRRPATPITRILGVWVHQHLQAARASIGQITRNPLGNLLTIAVIGVSLSLPAGFYLVMENVQRLASGWRGAVQITLFLKYEINADQARQLADRLGGQADIAGVTLIDRDQALEEYRRNSGFADALAVLEENPLPEVLLVQPAPGAVSGSRGMHLLELLQTQPEVETAQFDRQWANRLFAILGLLQRGVILLSALLAFAVLLIIGNTIRLAIYNRRDEIEITKLFGATDAFIQRPFLYSGLIHGLLGSLMAWLLLGISILVLEPGVSRLAGLYLSEFQLSNLTLDQTLLLLGSGCLLGLVGSWIAVRRHIRAIGLT